MEIRNEIRSHNDTVRAMIERMSLMAYRIYDHERVHNPERIAIARAIGDTLNKNIEILSVGYSMNRDAMNHGHSKDKEYLKYQKKATFMKFCEALYESGHYRIEKYDNDYEYMLNYQLAVFKIGQIDKE